MTPGRGTVPGTIWLLAALLPLLFASGAAAQLAPDARWRTLETPHFRVTFEADLEETARRAADRAERAYELLSRELIEPPRGPIELVIADNVDFANGYATPFPTNRIVIYAHPPVDTPELGFYDDWLELVVLHELVHIFHHDASRGIWGRARRVLGRNPFFFPGILAPSWVTEGLATYLESRLTGAGRIRSTQHEMALRTAILDDRFAPIDRATGQGTIWPASATRYVYGGSFLHYLARTRGPEAVRGYIRRAAGRTSPFRPDAVAEATLGTELTNAWREWRAALRTQYGALADSLRATGLTEPEVLVDEGRVAAFARYAPDGTLAYSAVTGVDEPAIRLIGPDGRVRPLQARTASGSHSWLRDGAGLVYGQLQYTDPYRIYSDLRLVDRDGEDRPLTRDARLAEPDVHPDLPQAVAVASVGATNQLVRVDLATGVTTPLTTPDEDVHWALPRWSPDGTRIAAARWTAGGQTDIVVLDPSRGTTREVTRDRAVDMAPTWSPDGGYLLFSSDRSGITNLYAYDLESDRLWQVTQLLTGGFQPAVSPDGRWIAFSWYGAEGYRIARIPFDPARWRDPAPPRAVAGAAPSPPPAPAETTAPARAYAPWPSLLPATWLPLVESGTAVGTGAGVLLSGEDVIERHRWEASLVAFPAERRMEGEASYQYRGFGNPVVALSAGQEWSVVAAAAGLPTALLDRERRAAASLLLLRRRFTSTAHLSGGAELVDRYRRWDDPAAVGGRTLRAYPLDLAAVAQAGFSTARGFGISLGPQQGWSATGRVEGHRYASPFAGETARRGYLRSTGRARGYQQLPLPGYARHVLALRLDGAAEHGSRGPGLAVGGASGGDLAGALGLPIGGGILGGGSVAFPIRGYPEGAQRGNRAAVATAEYRFPLLRVERGIGLLPLFLERTWGDLFLDAGAAWCAGPCDRPIPGTTSTPDPLLSVGAELNVDLELGFHVDLPLRFGAALPLERGRGGQVYLRVGRGF